MRNMILDTIKKAIKKSGKTRYQIAKETGVNESQLCKIMQGTDLRCATADILCEYLGLELIKKESKRKS